MENYFLTGILKLIGPARDVGIMHVLQVQAEGVCTEKTLPQVALTELVRFPEVAYALLPVLVRRRTRRDASAGRGRSDWRPAPEVVLAAVATRVGHARVGRALVERTVVAQDRTRPSVLLQMPAILVPCQLCLGLEAFVAVGALVLLPGFMSTVFMSEPVKSDDN